MNKSEILREVIATLKKTIVAHPPPDEMIEVGYLMCIHSLESIAAENENIQPVVSDTSAHPIPAGRAHMNVWP